MAGAVLFESGNMIEEAGAEVLSKRDRKDGGGPSLKRALQRHR